MKKFLSIILALALVLSIAPMTFATEGEATTIVYSPEYVFYSEAGFTNDANSTELHANKATFVFNREVSSGVWSYTGTRLATSFYMYKASKAAGAQAYASTASIETGNSFLLNLTVDADGVYIPTLNFTQWANGGRIKLYLIDKAVFADKKYKTTTKVGIDTIITDSAVAGSGVWCVADYNSWAETATNGIEKSGSPIELKAGDYYLMLVIGKGDGDSAHDSRTYAYMRSLKLERQPYVSVASDAEEIEIGKTAKLSAATKLGDETDAGAAVTYSAAPEGVVSVSADGTVTAISVGTATITAKATIGEKEYTDSVDVKVNPIDKTQKFVFGTSALSEATIAAATKAGKCNDSGLLTTTRDNNGVESGLEFFDEYTDMAVSDGKSTWAYSHMGGATIYLYPNYATLYVGRARYGNAGYTSGGGTTPYLDTRYIFKLKVKNAGTYDITADMINSTIGTEADVYFVKASDVESSSLIKLDAKGNRYRMTMDYIKTLPVDGRIGNIGANNSKSTQFVCTKQLEATDYYMILHLNTDHKEMASDKKQTLTISGITLKESDGSIVPSSTPVSVRSNVSFGTNIDGAIMTKTVARGEVVELSAPETDKNGKTFKCWVKGTEENGVWVSSKANDTYRGITHTYLTAVYEDAAATEGKVVEFYNENGEYYATVAAVDGKAVLPEANPTLAGYTFAGWYTSEEDELKEGAELSADITYAVAKFTAKLTIGSDTNDVVKVNVNPSYKVKILDIRPLQNVK